MQKLEIEFIKRSGRKKFPLILTDQEHVRTVFQQFVLSLPINVQSKELKVNSINHHYLNKNERMTFALGYQILVYLEASETLFFKRNLSHLLIVKDNPQSVLKTYKPYHGFYYGIEKHAATIRQNDVALKADHEPSEIIDIKDFQALQKRALSLESQYKDLRSGKHDLDNAAKRAIDDNYQLKVKNSKLEQNHHADLQLVRQLKKNYGSFLGSTNQNLNFIYQLVTMFQTPAVQNLTKGDSNQLLKLIHILSGQEMLNE